MTSKKNSKKRLSKKLRVRCPYGAGKKIAKELETTSRYISIVINRYNNGDTIYAPKAIAIIEAIKREMAHRNK
jgi:Mor family transcriptional regulator